MLIKEKEIISEYEMLFARKIKQYNEDGEELPSFETPFEKERKFKLMQEFQTLHHKKMTAKCDMKKRIIHRIETMKKPYFCTFTFDNNTYELKHIRKKLSRYFKMLGITNYCLISDYGSQTLREHYHGYIDLNGFDLDNLTPTTSKYKYAYNITLITRDIGFNLITPLDTKDIKKTIKYTLKYATKDIMNTNDFEHSMFCSRGEFKTPTEELLSDLLEL